MSLPEEGAPGEPNPPEAVAPTTIVLEPDAAPPAPAHGVVLRKDPDRRSRAGLGAAAAPLVFAAAVVPMLVVGALLWPRAGAPTTAAAPAAPSTTEPLAIDFAGLRAAVEALPVATAPLPAAAPAAPASPAAPATRAAPLALDRARVERTRALMKRIARARDARREAGAALAELKKPFSVDELGGDEALKSLGVEAGRRLLVSREGKVVAPTGADLPALPKGTSFASRERDEDLLEADATLAGSPVRVLRRCVAGELLCLVDVEAAAPAPAAAAASAAPAAGAEAAGPKPVPGLPDARAALLERLATEERRLAAATAPTTMPPPAPPAPTADAPTVGTTTTALPPAAALALGLVAALALALPLAVRLARTGTWIARASARLRAAAAGRAPPAETGDATALPAELAALDQAVAEALAALEDGAARAARDAHRRARAAALAAALDESRASFTARRSLDALSALDGDDDAALAEVAAAARRLVEALEARVVRWQSHVETAAAPPAVSRVEQRARALTPLPGVLGEAAQRLLRLARVPEMPARPAAELAALGDALASRGKTAQTLVDQLLLDAATDRPGERPAQALEALKAELKALAPAAAAPVAVAALEDLPPAEIAARLAGSERERS